MGARRRGLTIRSGAEQGRRRLYAISAAAAWIAAGLAYLAFEAIAAEGFRPHYSYAHNFISDLGITSRGMYQNRMIDSPLANLMNAAFCLQGTLFFVGAVLIARAFQARNATVFLTLAAANAAGNFLVATVHSGPTAQADGTIRVHVTGAVLAILGGNAAILAGSSIVRGPIRRGWYRGISVGIAALGLLGFALLTVESRTAATIVAPAGVWERCSVYSIIAWQLFTGVCLLTHGRRTVQAGAA